MRLAFLSALFVSAMAIGAHAVPKIGGDMPDKPMGNVVMIYDTDPALQCYRTAAMVWTEIRAGPLQHGGDRSLDELSRPDFRQSRHHPL